MKTSQRMRKCCAGSPSWPMATRAPHTTLSKPWCAARTPDSEGRHTLNIALLEKTLQRKLLALRQSRRGTLQSYFRAAQIRTQFRRRRNSLLARAHAGIRRRSALHRAAAGPHGKRGYRPRRAACARRYRLPPCKPPISSVRRKEIWRWRKPPFILRSAPKSNALYIGYGEAAQGFAGNAGRACSSALEKCGNGTDERCWVWPRLSIRSRL